MGTSLSVKVDGSWETVVKPYVKVDESWESIHNVWIKHGGSWELAHKTAIGKYTGVDEISNQTNTTTNATISGSYTVEQGTRYLRVQLTAGGGQGGGGARTGGSGLSGGHWPCPFPAADAGTGSTTATVTDYATGGQGGHPGLVDIQFEVIPGETYTWTGGTGGWTSAQQPDISLELSYYYATGSQNAVGSSASGNAGEAGDNITFSGPSGSITAGGGLGGSPGVVTVSSTCTQLVFTTTFFAYGISVTNPSQSSRNANSISMGTNLIHTTTNGTATSGGGAGGSYSAGGNIPRGTNGLISIWKYEA